LLTPLKNKNSRNNSCYTIRTIIPRGSVVNTFPLYDGKTELQLAERDYFIKSHTDSEPVYHFWKCLEADSRKVYDIVTCGELEYESEQMFRVIQEIWHKNDNLFLKSALFFMLNSYSSTGLVSSGEINKSNYNPLSLRNLKAFTMPEHFAVLHKKDITAEDIIESSDPNEYNLIIGGKFNFSLFVHGRSRGIEETIINHRELAKFVGKTNKKTLISFDYHPQIKMLFRNLNFTFVDEFGKPTTNKKNAKEVLIANF